MEFHPQNHCSGPCKPISSTLLSHPAQKDVSSSTRNDPLRYGLMSPRRGAWRCLRASCSFCDLEQRSSAPFSSMDGQPINLSRVPKYPADLLIRLVYLVSCTSKDDRNIVLNGRVCLKKADIAGAVVPKI